MLQTISAVGTVRYRRETPLGFTTPGKVATVRFEEGDYVKRGALLAALDTTSVGADLSVAEAERGRAQAEFERIKQLICRRVGHQGHALKPPKRLPRRQVPASPRPGSRVARRNFTRRQAGWC
jgi:multidrug efflux pump subunit AcrA (membrane-fusion protein)